MRVKPQSTYTQLTLMFGVLLLINFLVIVFFLRQLTINPAATQIGKTLYSQIKTLKPLLINKTIIEARHILKNNHLSSQITLKDTPIARTLPDYKFYRTLTQVLKTGSIQDVLLEDTSDVSTIWLKPQWLKDYWIGFGFQPFVAHVSQFFLYLVVILLLLSLLAAYFFSRYMLKPFRELAQMAKDIVEQENTNKSIKFSGTQEVKEIAGLVKSSAEKIQKLNKDKELLLAGVSHDLRTPLARMRLQAEFLPEDESQKLFIQEIEEMDEIIGDFVSYVRSGTIETLTKINLNNLILETIEKMHPHQNLFDYSAKNHLLEVAIKPVSFKRMLSNIYDNAIKYGKPPIKIWTEKQDKYINIFILDHGNGLTKKQLVTVFDPFVQAHSSENAHGSGLGLSIVKKLAEQNNATVIATNHQTGGLMITIILQS